MLPGWKNPFAAADAKTAAAPTAPVGKTKTVEGNPDTDPLRTKKIETQSDDPLQNLESLWQPNMDKDGKVIPEQTDTGSYMPNLDAKKLQEMVDRMDFTTGVTDEEFGALKEGGEKSIGAMMNMLNRAGRKSFLTAFQASSKMAEQGFTKAQERFMKNVPNHVRDMMTDTALADLPIMKNPMFAPLVGNVKKQFLAKFPKATPDQVNQGVRQYFEKMKEGLTPGKTDTDVGDPSKKLRTGDPTADFEAWLGDEVNQIGPGTFRNDAVGTEDTDPQ